MKFRNTSLVCALLFSVALIWSVWNKSELNKSTLYTKPVEQSEPVETIQVDPLFETSLKTDFELREAIDIKLVLNNKKTQTSSSRIVYSSQFSVTMLKELKDSYLFYLHFSLQDILKEKGDLSSSFTSKLDSYDGASLYVETNKDFQVKSSISKFPARPSAFMKRQFERINFVKNENNNGEWLSVEYYQNKERHFSYSAKSQGSYLKKHKSKELVYYASFLFTDKGNLDKISLFEFIKSQSPLLTTISSSVLKLKAKKRIFLDAKILEKLLLEYNQLKGKDGSGLNLSVYERDVFETELAGDNLYDVMKLLDNDLSRSDKQMVYFKMLSWISLNPSQLHLLEDEIKTRVVGHDVVAIVSSALGNSGSVESNAGDSMTLAWKIIYIKQAL